MNPKVSVVIKSYNHAAYVAEAIQSILDQSFTDFELLILDDGSADETPTVISHFADPRIDFQAGRENRGISAAMNSLISRARGEYIAILNSDDFAYRERLAKQTEFLDGNANVGAVFSLARTVDEKSNPTESYYDFTVPFSLPDFSRSSWLRFFFFHCNCLCAPTAMIRRSAYAMAGAYDPRLTNLQDLDMWIRIAPHADIHVLREELTAFRIRAQNANTSAPRHDTQLRSQFEYSRILSRFRSMDAKLLCSAFAADLLAQSIAADNQPDLWLAELALTVDSPAHNLFAIETLYECAQTAAHFRRLSDLTARVNLFGLPTLRSEADD